MTSWLPKLAGLILGLLVLTVLFVKGPPDTFGDMRKRLDSISVPDDFVHIGSRRRGVRSGFMAAGTPQLLNFYSAAWDEGELCNRIASLAATWGEANSNSSTDCTTSVIVDSGWPARMVNVWSYNLVIKATTPENVRRPSDADCESTRKRDSEKDQPLWFVGNPRCRVPHGHSLVTLTVFGKRGW